MPSREVWCCGVDSWTKVIAWLQMVSSAIALVIMILVLFTVLITGNDGDGKVMAVGIIAIVFLIFGLSWGFGFILLKGAKERNTKYLNIWLIYTVVMLVLSTLYQLFTLSGPSVFLKIIAVAIGTAWSCFLVWIVHIFKREIEREGDEETGGGGGGDVGGYKAY